MLVIFYIGIGNLDFLGMADHEWQNGAIVSGLLIATIRILV